MAKLDGINSNVGDQVRVCKKNTCGKFFSNHLKTCPHCNCPDYKVAVVTKEMEREIGRQ